MEELLRRLLEVQAGLADGSLIRGAIVPYSRDIYDLQIDQLFEGKASSGEDIRPYYSEDLQSAGGYFRTPDSAKRYADWKQNIGRSTSRNPDAPNLYINGKFHNEIDVADLGDSIAILPKTPYAEHIMQKYGLDTFGLTESNWNIIFANGASENLINYIRAML